jgi:hypothetical protein
MKRITDLLKRMNTSDKYEGSNYYIRIFSDFSGRIDNPFKGHMISFNNKEEMNKKISEIDRTLNKNNDEWTL